jgi:hypothetical protein
MKIYLYNYSMPIVFSYCDDALRKMNYKIQHADYKRGIISAVKRETSSSLSALLDLKFSLEKYTVSIAVISSTLSAAPGTIYFDPVNENVFIENLFEGLEAREIRMPFTIPEENCIEAMAV